MQEKKIVYYCLELGYKCFEDYINSLEIVDEKVYYKSECDLKKYDFKDPNTIHIFRYHIPNTICAYKNPRIFVLNTEQLSDPIKYTYILTLLKSGVPVIDYSIGNIHLLKGKGLIFYLPYQYNETEVSKLKRFSKNKVFDIGIVNCCTKRRRKLLHYFQNLGYKVLDIRGWNDERDYMIGGCKILLNIHFADNFSIYEHIRCDRWLFAGKLVISEPCEISDKLDIGKNLIFTPKLEEMVKKYIDKLPKVIVSNKILRKRLRKLQLFLEYIDNL